MDHHRRLPERRAVLVRGDERSRVDRRFQLGQDGRAAIERELVGQLGSIMAQARRRSAVAICSICSSSANVRVMSSTVGAVPRGLAFPGAR
jgi:hypothetical protein